jgi:hypothetical protein
MEITKLNWNGNPFLERLLFLMNKYNLKQEQAEQLAKLDYDQIKQELIKLK